MVETYNYICIKEILNRVLRHPLMKNLNLEDAIYYTLDFIQGMGLPNIYIDKSEVLELKDYRCLLPCDCVKVQQVRDNKTNLMLPYMTATDYKDKSLPAYKIQGNVIYTNFENGFVTVYYSAIKTDDDGLPMLPDTPVFIKALESYIKKEYFTVLFDCGTIALYVLQNAQNDWSFNAGHCRAYFTLPSEDEMEMIGNVMKRMIPERNEKYTGFKDTHVKEVMKVHSPNN